MHRYSLLLLVSCLFISPVSGQETYEIKSPDGKISLMVVVDNNINWTVTHEQQLVIAPSEVAMQLSDRKLGKDPVVQSAEIETQDRQIEAINYKKNIIRDNYQALTIQFEENFGLEFRAYNDGTAYRFFTSLEDSIQINSEIANFNFEDDFMAYIPYANDPSEDIYQISFENIYQHIPLSEMKADTLAFAPLLLSLPEGKKVAITEADLEDYPGMFLKRTAAGHSLSADFANYPMTEKKGGHNDLQMLVTSRADFIAKTTGERQFPWRVLIISEQDKDLLNNDLVYTLAAPSRIEDASWVAPGKVAWDWWNDWNISNVDFRAGINTETYKYYIDFAADYDIENILLDEGWAPSENIMQVVPEIDLEAIIAHATSKNVGVWLWGGWLPLNEKMDEALSTYAKMGIKGFKVDFMNRDDQPMVNFYYKLAAKAAEHQLMLDFHGSYKPTGLQRTFPNVMNFEGVYGLENAKWANPDFPGYDATIPFIRMLAGPMDYTPGAMINANKDNFRSIHSTPMSQGTRVHQLAMYIVYEAPFNMLADNPTNYKNEEESTRFIASIPTVFDETIALNGEVGKYATIARKKDDVWYIGALTNWDERTLEIDFSFLAEGNWSAEIFKDGINADREGSDYKREEFTIQSGEKMTINLAKGGGWAARIVKAD